MNNNTPIGIKQVIRLEWMQKTTDLLQSGISKKDIRSELEKYLGDKRGNGTILNRAEYTKSIAVSILMHIWVNPPKELTPLRDSALSHLKNNSDDAFVCHWLMYGAAYPFWFNVCHVFGSLFSLQNHIMKKQVMSRIYEVYGERSTIERCSRYAIRTLVAWDIIRDQGKSGIYEKTEPKGITVPSLGSLLLESALHAMPEKKSSLTVLLGNPAFFPFGLPPLTGTILTGENQRIMLEQYGLNEEYILIP